MTDPDADALAKDGDILADDWKRVTEQLREQINVRKSIVDDNARVWRRTRRQMIGACAFGFAANVWCLYDRCARSDWIGAVAVLPVLCVLVSSGWLMHKIRPMV